jgi:hypothetical protein
MLLLYSDTMVAPDVVKTAADAVKAVTSSAPGL